MSNSIRETWRGVIDRAIIDATSPDATPAARKIARSWLLNAPPYFVKACVGAGLEPDKVRDDVKQKIEHAIALEQECETRRRAERQEKEAKKCLLKKAAVPAFLIAEHNGETHSLAEWSRRTGISYYTLRRRFVTLGLRGDKLFAAQLPKGPEATRYDYRGEKLTIEELATRAGVSLVCMRDRIKRSHCVTIEEAVSKDFHTRSDAPLHEYDGKSLPLRKWAKITGLSVSCIAQRMRKNGMTFAEAITTPLIRKSDQARQMTALRMAVKEAAE